MYTLKSLIIIATMIAVSSFAMALNGPATSGQPFPSSSAVSGPATLQKFAQNARGSLMSGSASNKQKHRHGMYQTSTTR